MLGIKKGFWDFKAYEESRWFKNLVSTLLLLVSTYILLHALIFKLHPEWEYEYIQLDKEQMQQVNLIYLDSVASREPDSLIGRKGTIKQTLPGVNPAFPTRPDSLDSINKLKELAKQDLQSNVESKHGLANSPASFHAAKSERVMCFLRNEFNQKLEPCQEKAVRQYLSYATVTESTAFLNKTRFKVQSYFWLIGPLVYWEIIFWTWFGVICSLLFNLGLISKNSTTDPKDPSTYYDSSEIPSQVAKLLYAPLCTLIIILGYNFFNDENIVDISSSKGVLVFAFIGGFYSSRLIAFLDRLKEIILPVSSTTGTQADTPVLKNIVVQVQLDDSVKGLWDTVKTELNALKLTLQKEGSTQQAIALNIDANQWPLFIIDFVQRGNYLLDASWTTKLEDKVIYLQASQKVEMKGLDLSVTLKLLGNPNSPVDQQILPPPPSAAQEVSGAGIPASDTPTPGPDDTEVPVDIDIEQKSTDTD